MTSPVVDAIVATDAGKLGGTEEGGGFVFRGIPFAAPPVGSRRFAPPQPVAPWDGVRPATTHAPVSLQGAIGLGFMGAGSQPQSEDCLYLNVWTPGLDDARRPVLVWIHGGAFVLGAGSEPLYDGARLSRRGDVVVVSLNYRLGALGYLAHPALRDDASGAWGNWGLLDQIAGVTWVRENIAAFGGDPDNITAFGESAGAMSVTTIMTAPMAKGLFRRAIAQSGSPAFATADEAERTADDLAAAAGTDVAGLRDVAPERIAELQQQLMISSAGGDGFSLASGPNGEAMRFRPVIDGAVLERSPRDVVADGGTAGIDLLAGTNRDEMKLFSMLDQEEIDGAALERRLGAIVAPHEVAEVVSEYRAARAARGEPCEPKEIWQAIETDRFFRAQTLRFAGDHARTHPATYVYHFDWASPIAALGSPHAIEIPFVFGNLDAPMIGMFAGEGPDAEALCTDVQDAWIAFARSGDPSTPSHPWPRHDERRRATMTLGAVRGASDLPRAEVDRWLREPTA
jgi:para-nitrobenzyl esterase